MQVWMKGEHSINILTVLRCYKQTLKTIRDVRSVTTLKGDWSSGMGLRIREVRMDVDGLR